MSRTKFRAYDIDVVFVAVAGPLFQLLLVAQNSFTPRSLLVYRSLVLIVWKGLGFRASAEPESYELRPEGE